MSEHSSRRRFLRDTLTWVGGVAALSGVGIASTPSEAQAAPQEAKPLDLTRGSSALQPTRTGGGPARRRIAHRLGDLVDGLRAGPIDESTVHEDHLR
jgi:hypothetical protein